MCKSAWWCVCRLRSLTHSLCSIHALKVHVHDHHDVLCSPSANAFGVNRKPTLTSTRLHPLAIDHQCHLTDRLSITLDQLSLSLHARQCTCAAMIHDPWFVPESVRGRRAALTGSNARLAIRSYTAVPMVDYPSLNMIRAHTVYWYAGSDHRRGAAMDNSAVLGRHRSTCSRGVQNGLRYKTKMPCRNGEVKHV